MWGQLTLEMQAQLPINRKCVDAEGIRLSLPTDRPSKTNNPLIIIRSNILTQPANRRSTQAKGLILAGNQE